MTRQSSSAAGIRRHQDAGSVVVRLDQGGRPVTTFLRLVEPGSGINATIGVTVPGGRGQRQNGAQASIGQPPPLPDVRRVERGSAIDVRRALITGASCPRRRRAPGLPNPGRPPSPWSGVASSPNPPGRYDLLNHLRSASPSSSDGAARPSSRRSRGAGRYLPPALSTSGRHLRGGEPRGKGGGDDGAHRRADVPDGAQAGFVTARQAPTCAAALTPPPPKTRTTSPGTLCFALTAARILSWRNRARSYRAFSSSLSAISRGTRLGFPLVSIATNTAWAVWVCLRSPVEGISGVDLNGHRHAGAADVVHRGGTCHQGAYRNALPKINPVDAGGDCRPTGVPDRGDAAAWSTIAIRWPRRGRPGRSACWA